MESIDKEAVGLAGEYAVASELCKRGYYAQLTLGNHKKTDILVDYPDTKKRRQIFRVSVKSKRKYAWPQVKGIWEEGDLLVLVDFKKKTADDRPDFYVLTTDDWKKVIKAISKTGRGFKGQIDKKNTLHWTDKEGKTSWYGCSVNVKDVLKFKDCWPTLEGSP